MIILALLILIFVILFGTLGFYLICDADWLAAFQAAVFITTTIGLPESIANNSNGQILFISLYSVFAVTIFLSVIVLVLGITISKNHLYNYI